MIRLKKIQSWIISRIKLKRTNISNYAFILVVSNFAGLAFILNLMWVIFFHSRVNTCVDNKWFWGNVIVVLWGLLAMLITAFTFVLSIYLPPIIQEVKDLSAGIKKSCRNKIIRNNILSVNIFQMVISILIIVILILECLNVSGIIGENISSRITQAVIWYSVITADINYKSSPYLKTSPQTYIRCCFNESLGSMLYF